MADEKQQAADSQAQESATLAKATCGGCQTEQLATHKHCVDCGHPLAKASAAAFDAALTILEDFAKAQAALPEQIVLEPNPEAEPLVKADTSEADDAAIANAILGAQNNAVHLAEAIATDVRAARKADGMLAKAMVTVFTALRDENAGLRSEVTGLKGAIEALANTPGRSRAATVVPLAKAIAGQTGAAPQDDSLRGTALVKAAIDGEVHNLLPSGDATLTQMYANRGHSLQTIAQENPALAGRLTRAIEATQRAAS